MNRTILCFVALLAYALSTTPAAAQAARTWISSVGDDANPCLRAAPCRTWAGAIAKTASGGEIDAIDPGTFGTVAITKSITLDGGGQLFGSTLATGTDGITIVAGATDIVILRNLKLEGLLGNGSSSASAGVNGINYKSGAALIIENCTIDGFSSAGIRGLLTSDGQLTVSGTSISNIGTAAISLTTTSGTLFAALDKLHITNVQNGVVTKVGAVASLNDSVLSQMPGGAGLFVQDGTLTAAHNIISNAGYAAVFARGGVVRLDGNNLYNNVVAVQTGGGTVTTLGNNILAGNNGSITSASFATY